MHSVTTERKYFWSDLDMLVYLKQGSPILHHHWFVQLISVYAFALESTLAYLAGDDKGGGKR